MDIHIRISIYGFPGIPGGDPWIPWGDRWDLGTDGTWASRTPDTSSELFIDTRPGPARLYMDIHISIYGYPYMDIRLSDYLAIRI